MNYITHLTAVIDEFTRDDELNPSDISLYLALFYLWNINRFKNPLSVNRSEVMSVSKIGSKSTYHKCLKKLHEKKYIAYHPSHNPMKGSLIDLTIFGTTTGTTSGTTSGTSTEQVVGQVLVPSINNLNIINNTNNKKNTSFYKPSMEEVKDFFKKSPVTEHAEVEAEKYFNYYSSKGWVVGNKSPMKDWKAAARNWKLNANKFQTANNQKPSRSHLHVEQNKDYNIPL
jgi:hypothetical protein